MREVVLTKDGLEKLKAELDHIKTVERPQLLKEIKHARSYGDLRENFEYHAARQAQSLMEGRILELERMISWAKVVDALDASKVDVGTRVKIKDLEYDEEEEYALVDGQETAEGYDRISPASPIGQALLGKAVGEVIEVEAPAGVIRYEVVEIALL
ncbi:MAG TPA: transcription elongation factor GreA [Armatimonadota bacterium]|jgi:transcription elongation factor GreA